ncbi:uncharacterized protein Dwil_GK16776 [Drosophila willistoni]|uniref:DUF4794 domain-containing protein n=1 Tax=Drosophila willistoni TaxID=7260 RepID=B4MM76_DROWI|nr:ribosome biogenesis protein ERB1 [Drosophila willistoni]EDW73221.1 uncharacterized protein Dwil_GK16776 [Drosophila willistoni]
MVRYIYWTLALTLVVLACSVSAAPAVLEEYDVDKSHEFPASRQAETAGNTSVDSSASSEEKHDDDDDDDEETEVESKEDAAANDDDDDDDDDVASLLIGNRRRRRRREVDTTELPTDVPENEKENETTIPTTTTTTLTPPSRKPVLVLIRDALKKVTTELPTEQVANNALQYFQLFEHFIQQTIEQVIGDDDDDEDEAQPVTIIPGAATEEVEEQEIKKPDTNENETVPPKPEEVAETKPELPMPHEDSSSPIPNSV